MTPETAVSFFIIIDGIYLLYRKWKDKQEENTAWKAHQKSRYRVKGNIVTGLYTVLLRPGLMCKDTQETPLELWNKLNDEMDSSS